jgi:uracil-DNA glycosylase
VLGILSEKLNHVVFILWGSDAVESEKFINLTKHEVLKSYHPSSQGEASGNYQIEMLLSNGQPLSMNLFSQETHFLKVNRYLTEHGLPPVDWSTLPKP